MRVMALLLTILVIGGLGFIREKEEDIVYWFWDELFKIRTETEYGSVGRDTVLLFCEGKFQILRQGDENVLVVFQIKKSGVADILLHNVNKYKTQNDVLYLTSEEGFGIIDATSCICRLYITVPEEEYVSGYYVDKAGEKHTISRKIESDAVEYLESYDEFTIDERAVFDSMINQK